MRRSTNRLIVTMAIALCVALSACTVVRIGDDDGEGDDQYATWTKTGTGFQAKEFVTAIWDERVIPVFEEDSVDFSDVMAALRADRETGSERYGRLQETGEPFYVFKIRDTAVVVEHDDSSRNGVLRLDLEPADGMADATLQIGPVVRGTAIRDSLEFIRFTDIGNQLQFADLANQLNARMQQDSVARLDLENIAGRRIAFMGAFRLEEDQSLDEVVITPVRIDLLD